jgi:hypothetical protein
MIVQAQIYIAMAIFLLVCLSLAELVVRGAKNVAVATQLGVEFGSRHGTLGRGQAVSLRHIGGAPDRPGMECWVGR